MSTPVSADITLLQCYAYMQNLASVLDALNERLSVLDGRPIEAVYGPQPSELVPLMTPSTLTPSPTPSSQSVTDAHPTSATISAIGTSLPKAQVHPAKGKTADTYACTLVIPDALAGHLVGRGGRGLHQVHDISGARVSAFTSKAGTRDERHVSIRGTETQLGDALVVIGKRLARKRVRTPKKKKTTAKASSGASAAPAPRVTNPAPPASPASSSPLPPVIYVQAPTPTTRTPAPPAAPPAPPQTPPVPSVRMQSPPAIPSVKMVSPYRWSDLSPASRQVFSQLSSSSGTRPGSPMAIDVTTLAVSQMDHQMPAQSTAWQEYTADHPHPAPSMRSDEVSGISSPASRPRPTARRSRPFVHPGT
jgi:hypothetical protein